MSNDATTLSVADHRFLRRGSFANDGLTVSDIALAVMCFCMILICRVVICRNGNENQRDSNAQGGQQDTRSQKIALAKRKKYLESTALVESKLSPKMAKDARNTMCSICLEPLLGGANKEAVVRSREASSCDHMFHKKCIVQWLLHHNECPVCRCHYAKGAVVTP